MQRTYRLEDFLWTGSGDGEVEPSPRPHLPGAVAFTTTTVYKTTTATTTVLATPTPLYTTSLVITQVPRSPLGPISPTASFPLPADAAVPSTAAPQFPTPSWTLLNGGGGSGGARDPDEAYDDSLPDPRFWLVTVLKANDTQDWHLATDLLEARLARLYKAAFLSRQQERHLGIVNASALALARLRRASDVVRVTVHNVTTLGHGRPAGAGARLLYWVRVRGRPVPAATAAHDMRLISDHEMSAELGLPIITKAMPFLNAPVPLAARGRTRDVWLLVGAAGCANRRRHFQGRDNKGFLPDDHPHKRDKSSPGFLGVAGGSRGGSGLSGSGSGSGSRSSFSCASSCSGSASGSGSSSDAALVRRRGQPTATHHGHRGHHHHHHHHALHHAVNPALVDTLHLTEDDVVVPHPRGTSGPGASLGTHVQDLDVLDTATSRGGPARRASPNSYLSMPSVKQFPRGAAMPEPLTRVLEPVSVSHLDGEESVERVAVSPAPGPGDAAGPPPPRQAVTAPVRAPPPAVLALPRATVISVPCRAEDVPPAARAPGRDRDLPPPQHPRGVRHSSLEGDPGVLGPVVWGLRCQRLTSAGKRAGSDGSGSGTVTLSDGAGSPPQVGRMRRRFHELLDDAFSLFAGSRSASRSASQASQDDEDSSTSSPPPPGAPAAGLQLSSVLDHVLPAPPADHRVQSAVQRPVGVPFGDVAPRPKTSTTDARRPSTASGNGSAGGAGGPRGAWGSDQTVARPLSAGPFHRPQLPDGLGHAAGSVTPRPVVDPAIILADARLPPHDPAVPLIAAIKQELSKFGGPRGGGRPTGPPTGQQSGMPLPGYTPPRD
ncbi:hypothetical protein ONE63_005974 [Megalurothrips usitatus]|uniref:Uncharacterized protein n=1 Tax=Megalurothrips usitatus TaxID=439358 RepID=A0AAV7XV75_9NEOP|nr:hypothetical protein ONE63_005974 [Megalurothrips usitatus]